MDFLLGRYRNLTILVGVLFLQVLGLAVQVKRSADAENTRLIRIWAVDAITPFERVLVWAQNGTGGLWHNYIYLRGVRAENRELKRQIDAMHLQQVRLSEDADQAHRLQELLGFKEQFIDKTVAAQVIGSSGSDLSRSIYIDKGSKDGIAPDMAVITANGIVGKVLRVYPSTSLVLMINDQTSGVGAMLEKSRLQGVLKGTPEGTVILERVMSDEQVALGDTLLSSGGDQIFPKGLPVGTVTKVGPGREMFLRIEVKPAADLSRLEEVLVITQKREQDSVVDNGAHGRAADVLAQRLPSVPERPPVDPTGELVKATSPASGASGGAKPLNSMGNPSTIDPAKARMAQTAATSTVPKVKVPGASPDSTRAHAMAADATNSEAKIGDPNHAMKLTAPKVETGDRSLSNSSRPVGTTSTGATAKPAVAPPKLPNIPPNSQPPAADSDPH